MIAVTQSLIHGIRERSDDGAALTVRVEIAPIFPYCGFIVLGIGEKPQLIWMGNEKRIEQRGLGNGKDRSVGANTQRKRCNRDCRDAGTLREHSQTITHILEDRCNPKKCTRFSVALFEEPSISKLASCCANCILPAHALVNMPLSQKLNMRLNFVAELLIRLSLTEQPAESGDESKNQRGHDYS